MPSLALDDAEQELAELPKTFFSTEAAAERLGMGVDQARRLLTEMETESLTLRVCRDGWVMTWGYHGRERTAPTLVAYLDDMMRHLKVGYYVSYAAAAEMQGAAPCQVSGNRVNVGVDGDMAMDALELHPIYGPRDAATRFHPVDPEHDRPVAIMGRLCEPTTAGGGVPRTEQRIVRVAAAETILLDIMESPERCDGFHHVVEIALEMLCERLLRPKTLAAAASSYPPHVPQRTGSILQQLRGRDRWISLRPLWRHVRSIRARHAVAMHDGYPEWSGIPDRWGVVYSSQLDPDY
ncbi:type IV toxin-antitoxin system AbiEi family antitoxin [Candidatus Poriferisodalis sp.]|uniref:type IV toxin-antitoxin system AbiEi family antitoxin n=1 Tax=Candidatus Poriferisodalis sp. TaxID=3101277 RepID=UPI003B029DF0